LCLKSTVDHETFLNALSCDEPEEVIAGLLREANDCLSEVLGKVTNDDILNQIFDGFV
jgi:tRNA U34 5-carboxymethylaminomethyl modifying GTPase MnmE/TrmE